MENMKKYVGTKELKAIPMNKEEYCQYRQWEVPLNENPKEEGYLVEYLDGGKPNDERHLGYISWSPKDVFEKSYKENEFLTFGQAIESAKQGKKVARKGWNGQGMFAYIVPANSYTAQTGVAKEYWGDKPVPYRAYWALKTAQEDVATWSPSGSDSLAEDWLIVD